MIMEPFIGQILMFAGNFAPRGWALCDGQLLPISQHQALFSILGTIYGGDGRTTFALPDLRGRAPIHAGTGPGLTSRRLGEKGGAESVALGVNEMPAHGHTFRALSCDGNSADPGGNVLAKIKGGFESNDKPDTDLSADTITSSGGGKAHNNMPPYLAMNYIIALQGVYPSRS